MKKQNLDDISLSEYLLGKLHFVPLAAGIDDDWLRNLAATDKYDEFGGLSKLAGSGSYESIRFLRIRKFFWIFWIQISLKDIQGYVLRYYRSTGWKNITPSHIKITPGSFHVFLKNGDDLLQVTASVAENGLECEIISM